MIREILIAAGIVAASVLIATAIHAGAVAHLPHYNFPCLPKSKIRIVFPSASPSETSAASARVTRRSRSANPSPLIATSAARRVDFCRSILRPVARRRVTSAASSFFLVAPSTAMNPQPTASRPPVTCVVHPRVPSLVARLAQLVATFGNGRNSPSEHIPSIPSAPSLFLDISGHVGTVSVRYFANGWRVTKEDGEDTGETWSRSVSIVNLGAEDRLESLVRDVEAVCGIATSFAMIPAVEAKTEEAA